MKYSMLGLIERELQELETHKKLHERFISTWKKRRNVKLFISVPARLFARFESLVEHLPDDDDEYTFEWNDTFEMLANDIIIQYSKRIDAKQLFVGLQSMQSIKKIENYDSESVMIQEKLNDQALITVSLPYKTVLELEWIIDDVVNIVQEAGKLTVEKLLQVTFIDFAKRVKAGEVPNVAKLFSSHARGGVTA